MLVQQQDKDQVMQKKTVLLVLLSVASVATMIGCAANNLRAADASNAPAPGAGSTVSPRWEGTVTLAEAEHKTRPEAAQAVSGKVQSFNLGPRGEVEGVMLAMDGKAAQLNVPPGIGAALMGNVKVGDTVKALVRAQGGGPWMAMGGPQGREGWGPGRGFNGPGGPGMPGGPGRTKADHPVYDAESVTDAQGKTYSLPRPGEGKAIHVEGKVAAINYDRAGMVNGVQLASGEMVEMSTEGAKVLGLAVGSVLKVDGIAEPTVSGGKLIDTHTVNGILIKALASGNREAHPFMRGPGGFGPMGGTGAGPFGRPGGERFSGPGMGPFGRFGGGRFGGPGMGPFGRFGGGRFGGPGMGRNGAPWMHGFGRDGMDGHRGGPPGRGGPGRDGHGSRADQRGPRDGHHDWPPGHRDGGERDGTKGPAPSKSDGRTDGNQPR
jgi:hypothetical protein